MPMVMVEMRVLVSTIILLLRVAKHCTSAASGSQSVGNDFALYSRPTTKSASLSDSNRMPTQMQNMIRASRPFGSFEKD
jgi:hypothetical protein